MVGREHILYSIVACGLMILLLIFPNSAQATTTEHDVDGTGGWYYTAIMTAEDGMRIHPNDDDIEYNGYEVSGGIQSTYILIGTSDEALTQLELGTSGDLNSYTGDGVIYSSGDPYTHYVEWYGTYDSRTLYVKQEFHTYNGGLHKFYVKVKITGSSTTYYVYTMTFDNVNVYQGGDYDKAYFYDLYQDTSWSQVKQEISIGDDGSRYDRVGDEYGETKVKVTGNGINRIMYLGGYGCDGNKPIYTIQEKDDVNPDLNYPMRKNDGEEIDGWTNIMVWAETKHVITGGSAYQERSIYMRADGY